MTAGFAAAAGGSGSPSRLEEFERRRAACPPRDLARLMELAGWAERHDLDPGAAETYRRVLAIEPLHEEAHRGINRVATNLPLPATSAVLARTRATLSPRFHRDETSRFVVLSDANPRWTLDQAQLLERTAHQFGRFTRRLGLRPLPLRHKLVCVLFENRSDYQRFATSRDGVTDPWIAGYYAPAADRIVFYHGDTNPSVVAARARLDEMRGDIDSIERAVDAARRDGSRRRVEALRRHRDRYRRHVVAETRRVESFTAQVNTATTIHEAIHQLMFHTGVQTPRHAYPIWISEGLATTFETDLAKSAFGPDHEYAPRRDGFTELLRTNGLLDLDRLVIWTELPKSEGVVHAVYHQSYALVTWMSRFRKAELRAYLERLRTEPAGPLKADRALTLFTQAFGDVHRLERAWLRHERAGMTASAR